MWIWLGMWALAEAMFIGMLTRTQFDNYFKTWDGRWEFAKFIPIRFMIWPFLMVAMVVEMIEAIQDINSLHVWWFDEENFKL